MIKKPTSTATPQFDLKNYWNLDFIITNGFDMKFYKIRHFNFFFFLCMIIILHTYIEIIRCYYLIENSYIFNFFVLMSSIFFLENVVLSTTSG